MLRQTEVRPIQNAVFTVYQMSEDEKIREQARMREKALLVEYLNFKGAREEGIAEGMKKGVEKGIKEGMKKGVEKGKREERLEIAASLLNKNMPINFIAEITGLSEKEITALI